MDSETKKILAEMKLKIEILENEIKNNNKKTNKNTIQDNNNIYSRAAQIPFPKPLDTEGDIKKNISFFKTCWKNYLISSGLRYATEEEKISTLLSIIGDECLKKYENMNIKQNEIPTAEILLDKITENLIPKINVRYERAIFMAAYQKEDESIDQFINRLKGLIKTCQYKNMEEELLIDRIINGIRNQHLKLKLWEKENCNLNEIINMCKMTEQSEKQLKNLESPEKEEINKIAIKHKNNRKYWNKNKMTENNSKANPKIIQNCQRCGKTHEIRKCSAWKHLCTLCGKRNHLENKCKSSKPIKSLEEEHDKYENNILCLEKEKEININLLFSSINSINYKSTKCQIDTGATCNVMNINVYKNIVGNDLNIKNSTITLKSFGVDIETNTIISAETSVKLNIIEILNQITISSNRLIEKYKDVLQLNNKRSKTTTLYTPFDRGR